jgi:hypothetical protein
MLKLIADSAPGVWNPPMATVSEYKQYAKECLRWATEADKEEDRKAFLDMARDWTLAAIRLEGAMPSPDKKTDAPLQQAG